jgi:hypothetical protein
LKRRNNNQRYIIKTKSILYKTISIMAIQLTFCNETAWHRAAHRTNTLNCPFRPSAAVSLLLERVRPANVVTSSVLEGLMPLVALVLLLRFCIIERRTMINGQRSKIWIQWEGGTEYHNLVRGSSIGIALLCSCRIISRNVETINLKR